MAAKKDKATPAAAGEVVGSQAMVELSPDQQAAQALRYAETKAGLLELAKKSVSLVSVDGDDNMAAAKAAKAKLVSTRVAIEKTGKAARDGAVKFQKAVIAKERELLDVIQPEETRLGALIQAEERRREDAERVAREEAQKRADAIASTFARVRSLPGLAATMSVEEIDVLIAEAEKLRADHSHLPEDMHAAAKYEASVSVNALKAARDRREVADRDAAELAEFRRQQALAKAADPAPAPAPAVEPEVDVPVPQPPVSPGFVTRAGPEPASGAQRGFQPAGPTRADYRASALLDAARAALRLLVANDLGDRIEAQELADAIDDFDLPGAPR